jgi:hypothetical protein
LERSVLAFWVLAAATSVLLLASLSGRGDGLFGTGMFVHMVWSYLFGFAVVGVAFWILASKSGTGSLPPK